MMSATLLLRCMLRFVAWQRKHASSVFALQCFGWHGTQGIASHKQLTRVALLHVLLDERLMYRKEVERRMTWAHARALSFACCVLPLLCCLHTGKCHIPLQCELPLNTQTMHTLLALVVSHAPNAC
jgi:hypothetical protein